jgi:hypothetical protein
MPFKDPEAKAKWLAENRARRTEQARKSRQGIQKRDPKKWAAYMRAWYAKNRDKSNARVRADRAANPEKYRALDRARYERDKAKRLAFSNARASKPEIKRKNRDTYLQRRFGISIEEFDRMLVASCGRCGICGTQFSGRDPHVDHCHQTKAVRGLLCHGCNVGLGAFKDNQQFLIQAASYLKGGGQKE